MNVLYDKDHYKLALGQVNIARHKVDELVLHLSFLDLVTYFSYVLNGKGYVIGLSIYHFFCLFVH